MKPSIQRIVPVLLAILAAACLTTDFALAAEEEFEQTYTLTEGTPVKVSNINGSINVTSWDRDHVLVRAVKKTRKGRSELEKVEIVVERNGALSIETKYLRKNAKVNVEYDISLPAGIPLERAGTTNGSIRVAGAAGDMELVSTNGGIRAEDVSGEVEARSTNGNIVLENVKGVRDAKTTNGSITVNVRGRIDSDIDITTTNGSIELGLPGDVDADLDISTTNGRIRGGGFSIAVDRIGKNSLEGRVGAGGVRVNARTTNGGITLNRL